MLKQYETMPVLVTGAGGFIGHHLVRRLAELGAEVHALIRPGRDVTGLPLRTVVEADISDADAVHRVVSEARPRVVFHLAASLDRSRSLRAVKELDATNITGTLNVLRAAASSGVEVVVNTGSCEEYGRRPAPFTETQVPDPLTPYAASKATATLWCRTLHRALGLNAVTARLFAVYGPGLTEEFFLKQLMQAVKTGRPLPMTDGAQTRDFTWVGDTVEALVHLGRHPELGGEVLNVCTGHETSLLEAVRTLEDLLGRPVPVQIGAIPHRESELFRVWGSAGTLLGTTGYRPRTPLREGLEKMARAEGLLS